MRFSKTSIKIAHCVCSTFSTPAACVCCPRYEVFSFKAINVCTKINVTFTAKNRNFIMET